MATRLPAVACAMLLASLSVGAAAPGDDPAGWDRAAAARYLDARMEVWWQKAKPLTSGEAQTKCLSCHTAIPYALARPALRRAMGVAAATAHETTILETVRTRMAHLDAQQPFYDHTEDKKVESRGVEAVMNAFLLTSHAADAGVTTPDAVTQKALARLWEVQRADGAWDWLNFGLEPYETSDAVFHGATVAAMAAGSPTGRAASATAAGRAGVTKLREYVRANLATQRLFNQTWALLAESRLPTLLVATERDLIGRSLEARQRPDGGWSLADLGEWRWSKSAGPYAPPGATDKALVGASDAYATGLVVYALKQAGLGANRPAVQKGLAWLRANQQAARDGDAAWAPWRAHSLNFDREHGGDKGEPWRRMFMSDLATAFAVLALL
jgi:squalene-hopene/tetraprenyl-beta-curcumene cyclase